MLSPLANVGDAVLSPLANVGDDAVLSPLANVGDAVLSPLPCECKRCCAFATFANVGDAVLSSLADWGSGFPYPVSWGVSELFLLGFGVSGNRT